MGWMLRGERVVELQLMGLQPLQAHKRLVDLVQIRQAKWGEPSSDVNANMSPRIHDKG